MSVFHLRTVGYLSNIRRLYGTGNMGGILTIRVARAADIESIPDPVNGVISGDIVFKAGKGFVTWLAILETAQVKRGSRSTKEGKSRSNRLPFLIPKTREIFDAMFLQAEEDEFIVVFTESNGKQKIFGALDAPVQFEWDHETGARFSDRNSYSGSFYYDGPENIFFYTGAIADAPLSTQQSIVRYVTGEIIAMLNPTDILVVSSDFEHTFLIIPGSNSGLPALVKWDDDTLIASLQPGDTLVVSTDFTFDFEIIGNP